MKTFKKFILLLISVTSFFSFASANTLLLKGAKNGSLKAIERALGKGASVNCRESKTHESYYTPLHFAATGPQGESYASDKDYLNCVDCLLTNKADPTLRDLAGRTPLHHACAHDGFAENGRTVALIKAIREGIKDPDLLFDALNPLALGQKTPVHLAAENQSTKSLRILLSEEGVKYNLKDINNMTPEDLAKSSGWSKGVRMLRKKRKKEARAGQQKPSCVIL